PSDDLPRPAGLPCPQAAVRGVRPGGPVPTRGTRGPAQPGGRVGAAAARLMTPAGQPPHPPTPSPTRGAGEPEFWPPPPPCGRGGWGVRGLSGQAVSVPAPRPRPPAGAVR